MEWSMTHFVITYTQIDWTNANFWEKNQINYIYRSTIYTTVIEHSNNGRVNAPVFDVG